jgi:hypothetical protein
MIGGFTKGSMRKALTPAFLETLYPMQNIMSKIMSRINFP